MNFKFVKVCGMRDTNNIRDVEKLGIDLMGFIFWPKSSRFVSQRPDYLPTQCKRVGVFVDADIEQVRRIANDFSLDYIQLHGHESPDYIHSLRVDGGFAAGIHSHSVDGGFAADIRLIKAFNIATAADFAPTAAYEGLTDLFLFDTKGKCVGGNGEKFDWNVLQSYNGNTPFLLSGGIGPQDAASVKAFHHPRYIGIDLNSRFEISPGLKDIHQLKTFIESL